MAHPKRTDGSLSAARTTHILLPPHLTHTQTNTPLTTPSPPLAPPLSSRADDDSTDTQEIPLPNVKNSVLAKVIEFCKHHKDDPMNDIEKVRGWACVCFGWVGGYVPCFCPGLGVCACEWLLFFARPSFEIIACLSLFFARRPFTQSLLPLYLPPCPLLPHTYSLPAQPHPTPPHPHSP